MTYELALAALILASLGVFGVVAIAAYLVLDYRASRDLGQRVVDEIAEAGRVRWPSRVRPATGGNVAASDNLARYPADAMDELRRQMREAVSAVGGNDENALWRATEGRGR